MKVVSFVSLKGGTAKSTIARHCAVAAMRAGHKVVVVDCDQQGTLREWGQTRGREPTVIGETSTQRRYVEQTLAKLRADSTDLVLIDTPGSFEGAYSANAVALADFVVIPCRPSGEDTAAFWETESRVSDAGKPFGAIVSQAPTTSPKPAADLMALFRDSNVEVCPQAIHLRQIVSATYSAGSTVFEADRASGSDGRAVEEFSAVWTWLAERVGVKA